VSKRILAALGRKSYSGRAAVIALAVILVLIAALPAVCFGDALIPDDTEIETDIYVMVDADDGGVNFRAGAGIEYEKLIDGMIPNGYFLHITKMKYSGDGISWGYTEYEGKYGWVALTEVKEVDDVFIDPSNPTLPGQFGEDIVLPEDVTAYFVNVTAEGGTAFRYGPGTEYDPVTEDGIPAGTSLFIGGEALDSAGETWGFAYDYETQAFGWIRLSDTEIEDEWDFGDWDSPGNSEKIKLHKYVDKGLPTGGANIAVIALASVVLALVMIPIVVIVIVLVTRRRR